MLNLVVAIRCEALPLIEHYGLRRRHDRAEFEVYQRDDIHLIVSGTGKLNAAAACTYLHADNGHRRHGAWLNIGIAGHRERALGSAFLAHTITDRGSSRTWFPYPLSQRVETLPLVTVDQVELLYPEQALVDMEASGFYASAIRLSSCELVQTLKIVSDNRANPVEYVSETWVAAAIKDNMVVIDAVAGELNHMSTEMVQAGLVPACFERVIARWRFSHYQRHQLQRLLQRWQLLRPDRDAWRDITAHCGSARAVIDFLHAELDGVS